MALIRAEEMIVYVHRGGGVGGWGRREKGEGLGLEEGEE